jgi:hypothetical protein
MTDDPFYAPNHKTQPRQRTPGEPLFSFRTADHRQVDCELRFLGESWGWQAEFYIDREFSRSRSFVTREGAAQWAEAKRRAIQQGTDDDVLLYKLK